MKKLQKIKRMHVLTGEKLLWWEQIVKDIFYPSLICKHDIVFCFSNELIIIYVGVVF